MDEWFEEQPAPVHPEVVNTYAGSWRFWFAVNGLLTAWIAVMVLRCLPEIGRFTTSDWLYLAQAVLVGLVCLSRAVVFHQALSVTQARVDELRRGEGWAAWTHHDGKRTLFGPHLIWHDGALKLLGDKPEAERIEGRLVFRDGQEVLAEVPIPEGMETEAEDLVQRYRERLGLSR